MPERDRPDFRKWIRERVARLGLEGAREAEVVEELAGDLEQRYDELIRAGSPAEEARDAMRREIAGLRIARREPEPAAPLGERGTGDRMSGFVHDLRIALRMLRGRPGFALAAIGMLAVGIAANTAIFSVFNALMLRPLPFREPAQLVDVNETAPKWNLHFVGISNRDYFGWRDGNSSFDALAAYAGNSANLADSSGAVQRILVSQASANLLDTLGLAPALGRDFRPDEDRPGGAKVILLGWNLWHSLYQGDRGVVGRVIKLNEEAYTIVGVLPKEAVWPAEAEAWIPLAADPVAPSSYHLGAVGRLKHGVPAEQALADLARVNRNMLEARHDDSPTAPILTPLREAALGDLKAIWRILFTAVSLVLLIACVNIAGLMLVRGEARSREIAIRSALGASRGAIVRQLLIESAVLAAIGGALGVALGEMALRSLVATIPSQVPRWIQFELDWRFSLFAVGLTAAAAIVFGLLPALQNASADVRGCMQEMSRSTLTRGKGRILGSLAVSEVALAVVLLAGAALVFEAFEKVMHVNPGFRAEGLMTFDMRLPAVKYPKPEQKYALYAALLERLRAIPGVASAAAANPIPLGGHSGYFFEGEGSPHGPAETKPVTLQVTAMPGYFETMGIGFLGGRAFDARDEAADAPRVAIVNQTFANYYWPGENPVGKRIRYPGDRIRWIQVIGLTRDTRHYGLDQEMRPNVFVPFRMSPESGMYIVARTSSNPEALVGPAREMVRQLDADLPIYDVHTMAQRVDESLWTRRLYSWLIAAFAAVAVMLAAAGIYGVISFSVSQRTREIGIRMALGARPGQVMAAVLRTGMRLVAIGMALGIAAALAASRLIQSLLFGVSPRSAATHAGVAALVAIVGALANYVPARRAASVDPMRALRFD